MASQYKPSSVYYSNSLKHNKVAPPQIHDTQAYNQSFPNNSFVSPSSFVSTNPLIPYSYASQQYPTYKYIDESKSNRGNPKHRLPTNANRSYAPYDAKGNPNYGMSKNQYDPTTDDDEGEQKGKVSEWLSQPLCLGLTRLSGGLLFGSMAILACASIAGLIASIVLYVQDSSNNSQWKILGMVVCCIMLITIIVTALIFICCYKHGYIFNEEDDMDTIEQSATPYVKQSERQRGAQEPYKFNRSNDTSSVPSDILQDMSTPKAMSSFAVRVADKQTNTEKTIALLRPKDLNRGVWPSTNAYGGVSYRSLAPAHTVNRSIQVQAQEIEEAFEAPKIVYQVVAPVTTMPPTQLHPHILPVLDEQSSVIESTRRKPKQVITEESKKKNIIVQSKAVSDSTDSDEEPPQPVEYVAAQKKRPKQIERVDTDEESTNRVVYVTAKKKKPQRIEYVESEDEQPKHIEHTDNRKRRPQRIEYIESEEENRHPVERVDVKGKKAHRKPQRPQYEVVEEVIESSSSPSVEEIVDVPKHGRRHGKKRDKKQHFGKIAVKHVKAGV